MRITYRTIRAAVNQGILLEYFSVRDLRNACLELGAALLRLGEKQGVRHSPPGRGGGCL